MRFHKSPGCLLLATGIGLFALGVSSRGNSENRADAGTAWRSLGRELLFRWETGHGPSAEWLDRALDTTDPDSRSAVRTAELVLTEALGAYGPGAIIVEGRIALDANPQCILGLYVAQRFPRTRLGDWGQRQFHRCVEQTCLAAMPIADGNWHNRLEGEILAADEAGRRAFQEGTFAEAEVPYLYWYLVENGRSAEIRDKARECLVRCLWQGYGVESGLRQYLLVPGWDINARDDWIEEVPLHRIASHAMVKQFYEGKLTNADSMAAAQHACEQLVAILLSESRHGQARTILGLMSRRFPQVAWTTPRITDFLKEFQEDRDRAGRWLGGRLAQSGHELQALEWCRLFEALWTPQEAPPQWQALVKEVEPGSPAEWCSRVFLARALLDGGQTEAAETVARALAGAENPLAQAQGLALSAEIAHARGQEKEAVGLYIKALQVDRPTSLPPWGRELLSALPLDTGSSAEFQTQRLLLQGCHSLMDGDYAAAMDSLSQAATEAPLLPDALRRVLPSMAMLASLGVEDDTEAAAWGHRALERYHRDHPEDRQIVDLLAKIRTLDLTEFQLVAAAREESAAPPAMSRLSELAIRVCDAGASLESCEPLIQVAGKEVQRLYIQIRKRRDPEVLTAEYRCIRRQETHGGRTGSPERLEPLLFAGQALGGESLDRVQETFASLSEDQAVRDRMYRFAVFARNARQPALAADALDAAAREQTSAPNPGVLESIAEMYLDSSSRRKAIAVYELIAANSDDVNQVQSARLKIAGLGGDMARVSRSDPVRTWRDLGRQLLFRYGTGRGPVADWLDRELQGGDPDSAGMVRIAEFVLMKALDAYGRDAIVVEGRIPLNMNPQCILGLYAAERFSGTRLGDWGRRQIQHCIEQTCLTAMPAASSAWGARLEEEMLAADDVAQGPFQGGTFAGPEIPYLYCYLVENGRSAEIRGRARERLARCLWQEYGLESGLRQYMTVVEQDSEARGAWLGGTIQLDRIGPHAMAKSLYEHRLLNAGSMEEAKEACERLAGILLREQRHRQASGALDLVSQRFGRVAWTSPEIRDFLKEFREDPAQTRRRLAEEWMRATHELQILRWCRSLHALWTPQEAPEQWQILIKEAVPGSLAEQCGRVFLGKALLDAGRVPAAEGLVRGLIGSVNPFIQSQSLGLSAEIAHAKGQEGQSVRWYAQALRIARPMFLPDWCKDLVPVPSFNAKTPTAELAAQRLLLKGYHDLIDGDCAAAVDSLSQAAADSQLPRALRRPLACAMMLACLGVEDYVEAESWGYRVLQHYREDDPEDAAVVDLLAKIQSLDLAVFHLVAAAREPALDLPSPAALSEQAIQVCDAGARLQAGELSTQTVGRGIQGLYVQARKRRDAQVLTEEYRHVARQATQCSQTASSVHVEPLLFAAQILHDESLDGIQERFDSMSEDQAAQGRMHRFAAFALQAGQLDLAAGALDTGTREQISAADAGLLEQIADLHLEASRHQKAVDIYLRAAAKSPDADKAQSMHLKAIDICADNLKDWDKAIHACEEFIRKYPESPWTSQMEFRIGKLAYLKKDYSGAAGQLIAFQKKYPEHPQMEQAMLLTGLSEMADGNTQDAIGRFTEVIRRRPDDELAAQSKFLIGYAQISDQRYADALETFEQLIEQFPQSPYVARARDLMDRLRKVSQ